MIMGFNNIPLIDPSNIVHISVVEHSSKKVVYTIVDKEKIYLFAKKVNRAKKEIRKFQVLYIIEITYNNGDKHSISVNSKCFKLNGVTYNLHEDVIGTINSIVQKN